MKNRELAEKMLYRLAEKGLLDDLRMYVGRKNKDVLLGDIADTLEEVLNEHFTIVKTQKQKQDGK
jgi:hypothetical protein